MCFVHDRPAAFPSGNGAPVYAEVRRQLPLTPTQLPTFLPESLRDGLPFGEGVVSEKLDNAIYSSNSRGLKVAVFPMNNGRLRDFQAMCCDLLSEPQ